jgi:phosphoribosylaminoimidazolecarboxamide formyltransferase / IMP cyclohydrolase
VHGGLLADRRKPAHLTQLGELGIEPFDLVVVNLYPFRETVAAGADFDGVVEQIDIGGPAMVRASAKNFANLTVVVSPQRYPDVVRALSEGGFDFAQRQRLAAEAFAHTASYDIAVASWMTGQTLVEEGASRFPAWIGGSWERGEVLRYGENPHQQAALYRSSDIAPGLAQARQLHGKPMSYNNYVDTDAARRAAYDFSEACVAIVKHANPCGIAIGGADGAAGVAGADGADGVVGADGAEGRAADLAEIHRRAHACDPVSAFGGVIATNRPVSVGMAETISDIFTEVVCAPSFESGAVEILARKPSIRLLECPYPVQSRIELRPVSGGLLLQTADRIDAAGDDPATWSLQTGQPVAPEVLADLAFAWRAIRAVKSNAILLASGLATVGVGMGQVNRVDAARLAVARAGERAAGSVAASDAFFPFPDGFEVLAGAGVRAVVEPGGSVRDNLVIEAAEKAGVALYFSGTRHFAH